MSTGVFRLASAVAIVDGKEIDLSVSGLQITEPNASRDRIAAAIPRVAGATLTFRLSDEAAASIYRMIVGAQLAYGLRELHRNLGRYTRWPYTN